MNIFLNKPGIRKYGLAGPCSQGQYLFVLTIHHLKNYRNGTRIVDRSKSITNKAIHNSYMEAALTFLILSSNRNCLFSQDSILITNAKLKIIQPLYYSFILRNHFFIHNLSALHKAYNQGRRSFFPGGANFQKRALFVKKALQQKSFIATMSQSN